MHNSHFIVLFFLFQNQVDHRIKVVIPEPSGLLLIFRSLISMNLRLNGFPKNFSVLVENFEFESLEIQMRTNAVFL